MWTENERKTAQFYLIKNDQALRNHFDDSLIEANPVFCLCNNIVKITMKGTNTKSVCVCLPGCFLNRCDHQSHITKTTSWKKMKKQVFCEPNPCLATLIRTDLRKIRTRHNQNGSFFHMSACPSMCVCVVVCTELIGSSEVKNEDLNCCATWEIKSKSEQFDRRRLIENVMPSDWQRIRQLTEKNDKPTRVLEGEETKGMSIQIRMSVERRYARMCLCEIG